MRSSDLAVNFLSDALDGVNVDVLICGSIGAVESVRFIRSLRRLKANVTPWLSEGASQFITKTALEWAAAAPVRTGFSGEASHIATGDVCVVAPASANFFYKLANGKTDTAVSALAQSYLGQKKKIIVVPNMHESLFNAPAVAENVKRVAKWGVVLAAREEEGKQKFPEPAVLADHVAHEINSMNHQTKILLTMGGTRGFIDDVRYIANYSSGALGSLMTEEFYRYGLSTQVVCGPCQITPKVFDRIVYVQTNEEMKEAAQQFLAEGAKAAVLAASVLDFVPEKKASGKIRSNIDELNVKFKATEKLIAALDPQTKPSAKVGFKLEVDLDKLSVKEIAREYMERYQLSHFVVNQLSDVSASTHKAMVFSASSKVQSEVVEGKANVAKHICRVVMMHLQLPRNYKV